MLLAFLFVSVGCLATVLADDVVVYKGILGSYRRVQRRTLPRRPIITRDGTTYAGEGERQTRSITHRLDLVVSLIPRTTVVAAFSISLVNEAEKKAANRSVKKCLEAEAVKKASGVLRHQLVSRRAVSGEPVGQFYTALEQCLEPSRLERFEYSPELQLKEITSGWVTEH